MSALDPVNELDNTADGNKSQATATQHYIPYNCILIFLLFAHFIGFLLGKLYETETTT